MAGADMCPRFSKQLTVQYQCVDAKVLANTISACNLNTVPPLICPAVSSYPHAVQEQTWCDGASMSLSCATGLRLQILCAFYGVHPTLNACNIEYLSYKPVCYFRSSMTTVNATCGGLNSCTIGNFTSTFLDPCQDVDKALYVQWRCI
jgi:hypothetical protein